MKKIGNKKSTGLALGGGAVLGAAHIGVLRALEEFNIPISYIGGTSIGALVASLFAFGKNWEEIKDIALDMDWLKISNIQLSKFGLMNNKKLGELIAENIGEKNIEDSKLPLNIITTDISNGEKVVLRKGNVAKAVMATTCIPGIYEPVEINERLLVDGGIVENVPAITLRNMGAESVIVVDLNAKNSLRNPENIIDVILNSFAFALETATKYQIDDADIIIKPDLSKFHPTSTEYISDLIEVGYKESTKIFKDYLNK